MIRTDSICVFHSRPGVHTYLVFHLRSNSPSLFDASTPLRAFNAYNQLQRMDDPLPPNPYKVLNVPKDASLATIRSAYRKLVLTCHPDKVHDESLKQQKSEQFQQVQQAYEILSNDTNRQRYDERSKLAELRAELATERGSPRMPPDTGRRNGYSPATEVREGRVYEERVPRRPYNDEHFSSKYQEPRPSKKYEDDYFSPPPRRSSNRVPDEKRRTRDIEEERELERERDHRIAERLRREREKATEKATYSERTRRRDKDRRRESDTKSRSRFASYVNTDSESESDPELERYRSLKREATQKRRHEEMPRRSSKRETGDVDEYESREYQRVSAAEEYITKASRAPLDRRQTSYDRVPASLNTRAAQPPPPPPPPPPPAPPADAGRRSSERKHRPRDITPPRLLPKDRRVTEIVDPPPSRRPSMPGSSSDPRGLKNLVPSPKREPTRASTTQAVPEPKPPSLRRSETVPVSGSNYRRGDTAPSKSSKLKHADNHDSGYSSPGTPEYPADATPLAKSTRYVFRSDDDDNGHHIVKAPEDMRRERERETSPKNRRAVERPSLNPRASPSIKTPPTRSTSYAFTPETQKRPSASRTESARVTPLPNRHSGRGVPLYGEVIPEHNEPYKIVNQSPKIRSDSISYTQTPYSPRDRRSSEDTDRNFYSGSHLETRRPGLSRYESSAYESSRVH